MRSDIVSFFELQRLIFLICPHCLDIFRLSDCSMYLKQRPKQDWLDAIDREIRRLDDAEEKIEEERAELKQQASAKGRKQALRQVRRIDRVFTPLALNPDDAKTLLHPIDYLVFDGMNRGKEIKSVVLLDGRNAQPDRRVLQNSIETAVAKGRCEWQTLRVADDGTITIE